MCPLLVILGTQSTYTHELVNYMNILVPFRVKSLGLLEHVRQPNGCFWVEAKDYKNMFVSTFRIALNIDR